MLLSTYNGNELLRVTANGLNHINSTVANTVNDNHIMEANDEVGVNFGVALQATHLDEASTWSVVTRQKVKKTPKNASKVPKSMRICGESLSSAMMAGVEIQYKAIFHVDIVNNGSTVDVTKDFLQKKSIKVLSCFHAKSWMCENEQVEAFQLCVPTCRRWNQSARQGCMAQRSIGQRVEIQGG